MKKWHPRVKAAPKIDVFFNVLKHILSNLENNIERIRKIVLVWGALESLPVYDISLQKAQKVKNLKAYFAV